MGEFLGQRCMFGTKGNRVIAVVVQFVFYLLLRIDEGYGGASDVYCLRTFRDSVQDPLNYLNSSWNFENSTEGFICRFGGIDCWHPDENRVLNIRLSDVGLKGQFPKGLINCSSITGLDLSNNQLSGPIPSNICEMLIYITSLDLSNNRFSGEIPPNLSNCSYLNVLRLDNNQLTGQIPLQIGNLGRLKTFSVRNNMLSGQIPTFNHTIPAESYANNKGLCGKPLDVCMGKKKNTQSTVFIGSGIGAFIAILVIGGVVYLYQTKFSKKRKKDEDLGGNRWARSITGTKAIKVSLFEKPTSKMSLSDLMKATDNFNKANIIGFGSERTGTMYKAVLRDGSLIMVKRLQDSQQSEKQFMSEMNTLGSVKHRNLVPLLGFCIAKKERLLVYKYMPNGTIYDQLHLVENDSNRMEWPLRLRIALGAARGLAWLHHNCNPRIIHRNISSKCILLDGDFEPKISDFGLARLMNPLDTHLSTFVNGEFGDLGYVAPEYARTLVATPKGDVYSFGVVLLELVTGERPTHVDKAGENFKGSLVEWILQLSSNSLLQDAIDTCFVGKGFDSELLQFIKVACNCVLPAAKERPTMFEVYQLVRAIGERYNFSANDDIFVPFATGDADYPDELIVAR